MNTVNGIGKYSILRTFSRKRGIETSQTFLPFHINAMVYLIPFSILPPLLTEDGQSM